MRKLLPTFCILHCALCIPTWASAPWEALQEHPEWGYKVEGLGAGHGEIALVFANQSASSMTWTVPADLAGVQFLVVGGGDDKGASKVSDKSGRVGCTGGTSAGSRGGPQEESPTRGNVAASFISQRAGYGALGNFGSAGSATEGNWGYYSASGGGGGATTAGGTPTGCTTGGNGGKGLASNITARYAFTVPAAAAARFPTTLAASSPARMSTHPSSGATPTERPPAPTTPPPPLAPSSARS